MLKMEIDTTYLSIVSGLVLGFFAIFIVAMLVVFTKRVIQHREKISKLKVTQSQELLQSTIQTQEKERERIGADIHDDIGPLLSLLKLQINKLESVSENEEVKHYVKESKTTLNQILKLVRSVSNELSPAILNELGLKEAMSHMHDKLNTLTDAKVDFKIEGDISSINKTQSTAIYRILQESLNNIIRHTEAKNIEVRLSLQEDEINISVSDDGDGFDPEVASLGLGIKNIKARVESFGGKYSLSSKPKQGTQITIKMKKYEQ